MKRAYFMEKSLTSVKLLFPVMEKISPLSQLALSQTKNKNFFESKVITVWQWGNSTLLSENHLAAMASREIYAAWQALEVARDMLEE